MSPQTETEQPSLSDPGDTFTSDQLRRRIDELRSRLNEAYGDEHMGGIILADLADALYDVGDHYEALQSYEASVEHLRRTFQHSRLTHVERRIHELQSLRAS